MCPTDIAVNGTRATHKTSRFGLWYTYLWEHICSQIHYDQTTEKYISLLHKVVSMQGFEDFCFAVFIFKSSSRTAFRPSEWRHPVCIHKRI